MKKYVKFPLVLGAVALCSGLLLSGVYQLTKGPIEKGVIDRQTSAINDMFENISNKEVVEVNEEFLSKGISSIVKVTSGNKVYMTYTVTFKDSVGGEESTIIIALNDKGKLYNAKFVKAGDSYANRYNDKTYLATLNGKDKFDILGGASYTGADLNTALKLAQDCFKGGVSDPLDEVFNSIDSKEELELIPSYQKVKKITKVVSGSNTYYAYEIDSTYDFEGTDDPYSAIFIVNSDGTFYKIRMLEGNGFAKVYDNASELDIISGSSFTGIGLIEDFTIIQACHSEVVNNEN